jgi:hypothetical protein
LNLGLYENFPIQIHRIESFTSKLPAKQLQQKLIELFFETNRKELSFEEVANPTIPGCKVIFEFGLAYAEGFNYIDDEELKKVSDLLAKEHLHTIDFFCLIRYYRENGESKQALKFDYYLFRTMYNRGNLDIQVFHERGPRYISPEDLTSFIFNQINTGLKKKVLKKETA